MLGRTPELSDLESECKCLISGGKVVDISLCHDFDLYIICYLSKAFGESDFACAFVLEIFLFPDALAYAIFLAFLVNFTAFEIAVPVISF